MFPFLYICMDAIWDVFNNFLLIDATARSKISSIQKRLFIAVSLYPLSFFANAPFNDIPNVTIKYLSKKYVQAFNFI